MYINRLACLCTNQTLCFFRRMWFYREFKSNWRNQEQVEENYIGKNFKYYFPKIHLSIIYFFVET